MINKQRETKLRVQTMVSILFRTADVGEGSERPEQKCRENPDMMKSSWTYEVSFLNLNNCFILIVYLPLPKDTNLTHSEFRTIFDETGP